MDRLKELRIDRTERQAPSSSGGGQWIAVLLVLIALAVGGWWWTQRETLPTVSIATVEQTTPGAQEMGTTVLDASGYVVARLQATISSKIRMRHLSSSTSCRSSSVTKCGDR